MRDHETAEDDRWPDPWLFGLIITIGFLGVLLLFMVLK